MRKTLYGVAFTDFVNGLAKLGYYKVHPKKELCLNWRRGDFHVLLQHKGKGRVIISLHVDKPGLLPPYHRAIQRGKRIRIEFEKILESYQKVRQEKE